jgi:hypothetical protein
MEEATAHFGCNRSANEGRALLQIAFMEWQLGEA